jgi:phage pi2 protein 07
MIGRFTVDGIDVFSLYGIIVLEDGFNGIMSYPPIKEPYTNEWWEQDGVEVDLSEPVLDVNEFEMNFGAIGDKSNFGAFIEILSDGVYHEFVFEELFTKSLRLVDNKIYNGTVKNLRTFSLTFSDDFVLSEYSYVGPTSTLISQRGYEIDDIDFSNYGVAILEGSDAEILKSPAVKKNLMIESRYKKDVIYDSEKVVFQPKEVKLKCLMLAKTMNEFITNYNALLFDLTRPGERELYFSKTDDVYLFYYKNSVVSKFSPIGKIWFQFDLNFVFLSFRSGDENSTVTVFDNEFNNVFK